MRESQYSGDQYVFGTKLHLSTFVDDAHMGCYTRNNEVGCADLRAWEIRVESLDHMKSDTCRAFDACTSN